MAGTQVDENKADLWYAGGMLREASSGLCLDP